MANFRQAVIAASTSTNKISRAIVIGAQARKALGILIGSDSGDLTVSGVAYTVGSGSAPAPLGASNPANGRSGALWYTKPAAGNVTIEVTFSGVITGGATLTLIEVDDVNQTTPMNNFTDAGSGVQSISVVSPGAGDITCSLLIDAAAAAVISVGTQRAFSAPNHGYNAATGTLANPSVTTYTGATGRAMFGGNFVTDTGAAVGTSVMTHPVGYVGRMGGMIHGGSGIDAPLGGGGDTTITDALSRPPPTSGAQDYNSMALPALGGTYVDSVFGKTVRRLTNTDGLVSDDQIYGFHNVNSDGTLMFFKRPSGSFDIVNTTTGANAYVGQPTGLNVSECRWSHTDPNVYFYPSGNLLLARNLSGGSSSTVKDFGAPLLSMGGSNNSQDATDNYFIYNIGGTIRVWKRDTDETLTGSVPMIGGTATITPSALNVVTFPGPTAEPNKEHYAYPVNLGTKTIGAIPVMFWGLGGGHCSFNSCTDGKDYGIFQEAYGSIELYRCDLSVSVAGMTAAQQRAAQFSIIDIHPADDTHMTSVTVGALKNWCAISTEANHTGGDPLEWDDFNQAPSPWRQYKQEIIALNILTGTSQNANRRRLCHHRSRSVQANYFTTPRLSFSPTGNMLVWASNFNDSTPVGYADRYGILNPLTSL